MTTTLENLITSINIERAATMNPVAINILNFMETLTKEVVTVANQFDAAKQDSSTALQAENQKLKAQLDQLNGELNFQAKILEQTASVLQLPSALTTTQLPQRAAEVMKQLADCRSHLNPPGVLMS